MLRGSMLEMGGYGLSQMVRLASNLVLTRLLLPEALGLSQMVALVLQGLNMLSDVGVRQCVIQNERGEEPLFLDTAFTVQATRGALLAGATLVLAWPVSHWGLRTPELVPYLLVAALNPLITGLHSMSIFVLRRRVALAWVVALELGAQIISTIVMIVWALVSPSVWALIAGSISSVVAVTVASHFLPGRPRHRFRFDKDAYRALTGFGRWIFYSSAVYYVGSRADSFLLARYLGASVLGVYSIALFLAEAVGQVLERITSGVLYPIFSRAGREGMDELKRFYYRARLGLDLLCLPALGLLSGAGGLIVEILYDPRYHGAAWMLQWLCVRTAFTCLTVPCETCLSALGHPRFGFLRSAVRMAAVVIGVPLGWTLGGLPGLVLATALSEAPALLVVWPKFRALGLLDMPRELRAVALYLAGLAAGLGLRQLLPAGWP